MYLKEISDLKESISILKSEKYELYEEKSNEIRELKQQILALKSINDKNENIRVSKSLVENEDYRKKIYELEMIMNKQEVRFLLILKLI